MGSRGDRRRCAFGSQKSGAKRRGVAFYFTFEDWVSWWETNLGPDWFEKRGCMHGQYVMARKNDKGPYKIGNVKCITHTDNNHETEKYLSPQDIKLIFRDTRTYNEIRKHYKIAYHKVGDIKHRRKYADITKDLNRPIKIITNGGVSWKV